MAESMVGLKRTHRCTEVSAANIGETVTVMGWVQTRRNLGALIFVDLRTEVVFYRFYLMKIRSEAKALRKHTVSVTNMLLQ